ncbi:MAG: hypothetical protein V8R55_04245 [Dysosmobacter sp.]
MVSNVPGGSGLSSSAAFEVLIGTILNDLFWGGKCSAVEIAQIGQYAENVFFGKPCGLMDQTASSVGGVVAIDFADTDHPVVERMDLDLHKDGYALCILDSGADHADLTDEYAAITGELKAVCAQFGKDYLRQVPGEEFLAQLSEVRAAAGDRAALRAFHVYAENDRAAAQAQALQQGRCGLPRPGARLRRLFGHVPAKRGAHGPDPEAGADAHHRSGRVFAWRPGGRPGPRRRFRRHGPGVRAPGPAGHVQKGDRGRAGRGRKCHVVTIRPEGGARLA